MQPTHVHGLSASSGGHGGESRHHHDPASPHPAQPPPWSLLRLGVSARLGAVLVVAAGLWLGVWWAMGPS